MFARTWMIAVSSVCTKLISPKECRSNYSCAEERSERTLAGNVQELVAKVPFLSRGCISLPRTTRLGTFPRKWEVIPHRRPQDNQDIKWNGVVRRNLLQNTPVRVILVWRASIGNEKGWSVFLPSEYQARRPKVPFRSRRVARTVGVHFCTRFMLEIYLTLRSAMRKVTAWFYPQNIRRAARKFLSAQGASPEQWVNTSVRVILEIYLTLRSAMRKVTACFYPQNIRRAARKFLSAQVASPEQWVNTSVRLILEIYLTLRSSMRKVTACFYPRNIRRAARSSFPFKARRPNSGRTLPYVLYSEIYLTPNNSIDVITIATIFQNIRIGGRSVMQTTRIFS